MSILKNDNEQLRRTLLISVSFFSAKCSLHSVSIPISKGETRCNYSKVRWSNLEQDVQLFQNEIENEKSLLNLNDSYNFISRRFIKITFKFYEITAKKEDSELLCNCSKKKLLREALLS